MDNKNMKPTIFIDCDGVLADCDSFIMKHFGKHYTELGGDYVWTHLTKEVPNIFSQLEPLADCMELMDGLKQYEDRYNLAILTAIPRPSGLLITAAHDKVKWVRKHIHPTIPVHCVLGKELKKHYVNSTDDILVDDHFENISDWIEKGGIGVIHTTAASSLNILSYVI
jgi:5'-nucleotidase